MIQVIGYGAASIIKADTESISFCDYCEGSGAYEIWEESTCAPVSMGRGYYHLECWEKYLDEIAT